MPQLTYTDQTSSRMLAGNQSCHNSPTRIKHLVKCWKTRAVSIALWHNVLFENASAVGRHDFHFPSSLFVSTLVSGPSLVSADPLTSGCGDLCHRGYLEVKCNSRSRCLLLKILFTLLICHFQYFQRSEERAHCHQEFIRPRVLFVCHLPMNWSSYRNLFALEPVLVPNITHVIFPLFSADSSSCLVSHS